MSHFIYPVFLPLLVFVIDHIARCAPSSKFKNQQNTGQNCPTYSFTITKLIV